MIDPLLIALADGDFHSGDALGNKLAISRTAVWKRLKKIEALGLPLESVKGRGYRIPGGVDLLSRESVWTHLPEPVRGLVSDLELLACTPSTNQHAMARAVEGACGYVCAAEQQTDGRGRRGRGWVSPFAANIYLSVVWEYAGGAAALEGLSLAVGIAVVEALEKAGLPGARLKWPNDVLYDGRKLAGVLLEMVGDAAGPCRVVVGVGLNVAMPEVAHRHIGQPWIDVTTAAGKPVRRSYLLAMLLSEMLPLLADFEQRGFAHFQQRWRSLDAFDGREVFIHHGGTAQFGVAAGVDASGAMVLQTPTGQRVFSGGEVSLRSAD